MKLSGRYLVLAVFSAFILSTASFAEDVLWIGVTPNSPPIIYKSKDTITGLEADFARELCKDLQMKPEFIELPWDDQIPALIDNKIDIIISGMTITDTRMLRISFSDPYLRIGQLALVRTKDFYKYQNPVVLFTTKEKVGVEKGTTGDLLVQKQMLKAQRVAYISISKAVSDLKDGEIVAFIHDAPVIWQLYAENEMKGLSATKVLLTEEYLAWGMRREDKELIERVNRTLAGWRQSGRLDKILEYWLPYLNK